MTDTADTETGISEGTPDMTAAEITACLTRMVVWLVGCAALAAGIIWASYRWPGPGAIALPVGLVAGGLWHRLLLPGEVAKP
jgi:predicted naringenin-chalcone synthase